VRDAGGSGRVDRRDVLGDPSADRIGADQQQPVPAGERVDQRLRVVEIARPHGRPARRELRQRVGPARDQHQLVD
jgi:hypothetical protein